MVEDFHPRRYQGVCPSLFDILKYLSVLDDQFLLITRMSISTYDSFAYISIHSASVDLLVLI